MLLIVDDDPAFLVKAQDLLDEKRHNIYFARDAQQARSLMGSVGADFTLVRIDLDLPGQDGFSLIAEMRRNFPDLPIVAVSGVYQASALESARALGAAEVLSKPVTAEW